MLVKISYVYQNFNFNNLFNKNLYLRKDNKRHITHRKKVRSP